MSTVLVQGSVIDLPAGDIFQPFDLRVPCSPDPSKRVFQLTSDAPFAVSLDGMTGVNVIHVQADQPVRISVDSAVGTAQTLPLEYFSLISRSVAITAITFLRVAGQATTVTLILGQEA